MVRNAGGRVFDAIRTLAVLQTIGAPGTIAVMHHTGMSILDSLPAGQSVLQDMDGVDWVYDRLRHDPFPRCNDTTSAARDCASG